MELIFFTLGLFSLSQLGLHSWPSWSTPLGIPVDYLSPTIYLIDLFLILFLPKGLPLLLKQISRHPFLSVFLVANIIASANPLFSLYQWTRVLLLSAFVLALANTNKKNIDYLIYGLLISTLSSSLLAIAQFISQGSLGGPFYWLGERTFNISTPNIARQTIFHNLLLRPYSTFSHPNSLAGFLLVSNLILLHFRKLFKWKILLPTITSSAITLFLTASKSSLIALPVLGLIYLLRANRKILVSIILALTLIFVASHFFADFFPQSIEERLVLNKQSLLVISSNPLFGVGLGNYIFAQVTTINPLSAKNFLLFLQPVHNTYLLLLAELGIIFPLILFLKRPHLNPPHTFLFIAAFCVFFTGLFDHYWITLPQNRILFGVFIGLYLKTSRRIRS